MHAMTAVVTTHDNVAMRGCVELSGVDERGGEGRVDAVVQKRVPW